VFLCGGRNVFAQDIQARFLALTGTVEVQKPGAAWTLAAEGDAITANTIISTGFKSTALLSLGNSTLAVRPLTRLTLSELTQRAGGEQIDLYLQTGRVRAEVTPPAGGKTDFTVRSPSVTASVRGTAFEFDTLTIQVEKGRVQYSGVNGQRVYVIGGEQSYMDESENRIVPPLEAETALLTPSLPELNNTGSTSSGTAPAAIASDVGVGVEWP
jgi:hypothetical protein